MSIEYTSRFQGVGEDILFDLDCIKDITGWIVRNRSKTQVQLHIDDLNNVGMDDAVVYLGEEGVYIAVHRATGKQRDELIRSIEERLTHQLEKTISIEEI